MGFLVLAGVAAVLALSVCTDKTRDKVSSVPIDPLVDRLMADGILRILELKPPRQKLRRPSRADAVFGIPADKLVLEPSAAVGEAVSEL